MPDRQNIRQVPPLLEEGGTAISQLRQPPYDQFLCIFSTLSALFAVMKSFFALLND